MEQSTQVQSRDSIGGFSNMVKVVVLVKDGSSTQLERSRKNCHLACVVTFASMSPFSGSTINSEYEFYRCINKM